MKRTVTVLSLLALLALIPSAPNMAQASPAATSPNSSGTTAPLDVVDFLAILAGGESSTPDTGVLLTSSFQATTCTSHADCPQGQLCCYPCGIDGCDFVCMTPERRRCPMFP